MARQPKLAIPPLLPLEYCRIDRAARLLGCEESDLLHWGAIGAIALWANFDGENNSALVIDRGLEHRAVTDHGTEYVINNLASYIPIRDVRQEDDSIDGAFFAYLKGFWRVGQTYLKRFENQHTSQDSFYATVKDEKNITVFAFSGGKNLNKVINRLTIPANDESPPRELAQNDLWIMRDGLMLVHLHINSGEPIPINMDDKEIDNPHSLIERHHMSSPHPVTERHAVNRESVLAAAIHIKHQWPKECGDTARQWAEQLDLHAHQYWSDGLPPLSREAIERLLSSAMKDGKPHKKS